MNRTLKYPPEMAGFKPYGAVVAAKESADKTVYRAALGSIGDDKATFYVWVWSETVSGVLTHIPINDPPTDAPSFHVAGGILILSGRRGTDLVERDVPGFLVPASTAVDQGARDMATQAGWQANQATKMATNAMNVNDTQAHQIAQLDLRVTAMEG